MHDDDDDDLWWLATEFSIYHAALLIAGYNPSDAEDHDERSLFRQFPRYLSAKTAILNAVESKRLNVVKLEYEEDSFSNSENRYISVHYTLISIESLDEWTRSRGRAYEIFNPNRKPPDSSAIGTRQYVSKKLVAANRAWAAVTSDPTLLAGKSPKQALEKWLLEHAEELDLLTKDGKPNRTGIEEICKVANWKPEGGATPTQQAPVAPPPSPTTPSPTRRRASGGGFGQRATGGDFGAKETFDLDDEIPF